MVVLRADAAFAKPEIYEKSEEPKSARSWAGGFDLLSQRKPIPVLHPHSRDPGANASVRLFPGVVGESRRATGTSDASLALRSPSIRNCRLTGGGGCVIIQWSE